MADDRELVESTWPALGALRRTLEGLPAQVQIPVSTSGGLADDLLERLARDPKFADIVANALRRSQRHNAS
jgi:hypothetical protein